jgi:hypothetical protein
MADDDTTDPAAPSVAELAERQERTEGKLDQLLDIVKGIPGKAHPAAQDATEARLDAPGNVAAQVQAELDRRAKAEDTAATVGSLKETVAKLTEVTPADPPRRIHRIMGWGS